MRTLVDSVVGPVDMFFEQEISKNVQAAVSIWRRGDCRRMILNQVRDSVWNSTSEAIYGCMWGYVWAEKGNENIS